MYKVKGSIWIENRDQTFIGYGRAILLNAIKKHGSITLAAKSMKMSYRHAWEMLNEMNKQSKNPLIKTSSGGAGGGGTMLTKDGELALKCFWELHSQFTLFNSNETRKLKL